MKRIFLLVALLVGVGIPAGASAAPMSATLTIRHQLRGCHTWSLNGGAYTVVQRLTVARGGSLLIRNNDVMPHRLVKGSGPAIAVKLVNKGGMMGVASHGVGMMSHMGATLKVTFTRRGVYSLSTKAGEDYMEMGDEEEGGPDNVLRAIVTVS